VLCVDILIEFPEETFVSQPAVLQELRSHPVWNAVISTRLDSEQVLAQLLDEQYFNGNLLPGAPPPRAPSCNSLTTCGKPRAKGVVTQRQPLVNWLTALSSGRIQNGGTRSGPGCRFSCVPRSSHWPSCTTWLVEVISSTHERVHPSI